MSNLDKIKFKDYMYDYNDVKDTSVKLLDSKQLKQKIQKLYFTAIPFSF